MREPTEADRLLIDTARKALFEITDAETVGAVVGLDESNEGVVDVLFASTMAGYPSWRWNVAVSIVDGRDAPSVLEAELLPGEGALLAPDWVPWADRMADYRAAQIDDADDDSDEDDDDDDDDDDDEEESDEDETDLLDHDDEIDGVDFEANDEAADDDDDDDESDDDDDDESDDDIDSDFDDDDEEPLTSNR